MKKKIMLIFSLFIFIFSLSSCNNQKIKSDKEIICEDVMRVYEKSGYDVFHKETTDQDYIWNCYVKCTAPDSNDYIFFYFFETTEEAENYAKERKWNIILYFSSCLMGDPSWLTTKNCNNIEIEYDENYLYKPFKELL